MGSFCEVKSISHIASESRYFRLGFGLVGGIGILVQKAFLGAHMKYQILFFNQTAFAIAAIRLKYKPISEKRFFLHTVISITKSIEIDYLSDQNRNSICMYIHISTCAQNGESNKFLDAEK